MDNKKQKIDIGQRERETFALLRSCILGEEEKDTMRQMLRVAVIESREVVPRSVRSDVNFFSFFLGRKFVAAILSVVLIIGSGLSVARAAGQALPGETLYPMKTQFGEPLIASFKNSDTARAEWTRTLIERRIVEAEKLAEKGRLGENEKSEIEKQLSKHRSTLNQLEGHEITDDEFIPLQPVNETKKIKVLFEHRGSEARVRIEERDSDGNTSEGNENEEGWVIREQKNSSSGQVKGIWQEDVTTFDEQANGERKVKDQENSQGELRSKSEKDKGGEQEQKVKAEEKKDIPSEESDSSNNQKFEQNQSE